MRNIAILIVLLLCTACSDEKRQEEMRAAIKSRAEEMGKILVKKDYNAFVKCTYPAIVDLMGGEVKMIEVMKTGAEQMEKEGSYYIGVTIGEPSDIIEEKDELQATVPIVLELKVPKGKLKAPSTLIAISTDKGITWTFVDTSGKSLETMRKVLPNLSETLFIPDKQDAKFSRD